MTDWITVGVSLIGGSLGGMAIAPLSAQRQELGRDRYRARELLRAELSQYLDQLKYDHGGPNRKQAYPLTYASIPATEALTEFVARHLPTLSRRCRRRVWQDVRALVGEATLNLAVERAYLPDHTRDTPEEERRLEVADRHLLLEQGYATRHGVLGQLRASQNDAAAHDQYYKQALEILSRMIRAVS